MAFKLKYKNSAFPFKTDEEMEPKPKTKTTKEKLTLHTVPPSSFGKQKQVKELEESFKTRKKEKKKVKTYVSKKGTYTSPTTVHVEGGGGVKAPRGGSFSAHVQTEIDKRTGKTIVRPDFKYTNPKGWSIGVSKGGINIGKTF